MRVVSDVAGCPCDGVNPAQPLPIWVVNLDQSTDRWRDCEEELAKQCLSASRFPATFGAAMTDGDLRDSCTWAARYFCTAGMIGCFVSHSRIWHRVADEGCGSAVVVLEDDFVLYPDFSRKLQVLLDELPAHWDVCLLGAVGCIAPDREPLAMKLYELIAGGGRPSPGRTRSISQNIFIPFRPAGTHAYVVSQEGARKLCRLCPKVRYHVDLTAWSLQELNLYAAKDLLATQRFGDDTTVSKHGAPCTERFLRFCWDFTGLSALGRAAGVLNLTWAWKIACFALPVPCSTTRRRFIVEMGPASSAFILTILASCVLRSRRLAAAAVAYMLLICCIIRGLAGTFRFLPMASLALVSAVLWLST